MAPFCWERASAHRPGLVCARLEPRWGGSITRDSHDEHEPAGSPRYWGRDLLYPHVVSQVRRKALGGEVEHHQHADTDARGLICSDLVQVVLQRFLRGVGLLAFEFDNEAVPA